MQYDNEHHVTKRSFLQTKLILNNKYATEAIITIFENFKSIVRYILPLFFTENYLQNYKTIIKKAKQFSSY